MDPDLVWHSIGGGAILAAALTLARLLLDYSARGADRRIERDERHLARQRDAEARLERVLQDRIAEGDRRLEREHLLLMQVLLGGRQAGVGGRLGDATGVGRRGAGDGDELPETGSRSAGLRARRSREH